MKLPTYADRTGDRIRPTAIFQCHCADCTHYATCRPLACATRTQTECRFPRLGFVPHDSLDPGFYDRMKNHHSSRLKRKRAKRTSMYAVAEFEQPEELAGPDLDIGGGR